MAKRKRAPAFRVYGTADYFRDRDRLFTHGQYTIDRKVKTKAEALDMAYGFMLNNQPRGPNAYVLVEKTTSRGRDQIGSWNGDNWGEMAEATMRRNAEVDEQDIKWALEAALETMADEEQAQSHSMLHDQLLMDLGDMGYDTDEVYVIAEFGDEVGVSEDILVNEFWYKELKLAPPENVVDKWGEAQTKKKGPGGYGESAASALGEWLGKHGYERVDQLGGAWPVGDEHELEGRFIVDRVTKETGASEDAVWEVLEEEFGATRDGQVYWSGHSGQIDVYAIPLETEEED